MEPVEDRQWWFEDACGTGMRTGLLVQKIHEQQTRFQHVEVLEHKTYGRVLVLDGIIQTTTADEFLYHEMISHVPILGRPTAAEEGPCSVLIIGGGDGGSLREVLRHAMVERVVMVEIDAEVIGICREHLGIQGDFDDPRVQLIIGDGAEYVASASKKVQGEGFDVILVDSTDPFGGPSRPLFTAAFTKDLRACLRPGGATVRQFGIPMLSSELLLEGVVHMRQTFQRVQVYRASIPSYIGGDMAFLLGLESEEEGCEQARQEYVGRWYSPAVHAAAFALPPMWQDLMGEP